MCSISGCASKEQETKVREQLEQINHLLTHRGPDANGIFIGSANGSTVGLAHNRLSILDLSSESAQPFHFHEKLVMVYNGELYNYKELRESLIQKGYTFHTTGDTEVLIAAYHAFREKCINYFDGMFAFAIWDKDAEIIFCARDRFGEKPFYFSHNERKGDFRFASEIKAILDTSNDVTVDETMLYQFLTHGFTKIPNQPWKTFYKHIYQLPASHTLTYHISEDKWEMNAYWDLDKVSVQDDKNAVERFSALLSKSVERRLRADVPIGTSLSGGVDSSSIAALVSQKQNGHKAFSAVFPRFEKDESQKINTIAQTFNIELHTITADANTFAQRILEVIDHHREPIGSASVFAQYLVYEKASTKGVKVLLDGQGADEIFAGYRKYTHWYLQELIKTVGWKEASNQALAFKGNDFLDQWSWKNFLAAYMPSLTAIQLEKRFIREQRSCRWIHPDFAETAFSKNAIHKPIVEKLNDIQYHDIMMMGLEELLRYADRNAMAHGVEVRLPFLSHELVQLVMSLPSSYRMRNGYTKWILRESMNKSLPEDIIWQKGKIGFEPPQKEWMKAPVVKDLIEQSRKKLNELGITRQARKELSHNQEFRILVAGSLLG